MTEAIRICPTCGNMVGAVCIDCTMKGTTPCVNVERAALSAAPVTEESNMDEGVQEYEQAHLAFKIVVDNDGFIVYDPWGRDSGRRPVKDLDRTTIVLDSMRFEYTIEDNRAAE